MRRVPCAKTWVLAGLGLGLASACQKEVQPGPPDAAPPAVVPDSGVVVHPDAEPPPPRDAEPAPDALLPPRPDAGFVRPDTGVPPGDAGAPTPRCNPSLTVTPRTSTILPLDLLTLVGHGGTGLYRFDMRANMSGAILNRLSGAYLSGERTEVTDTIVLTDEGCVGTATATVRVVQRMTLEPTAVTLPPGGRFTYRTQFGSGRATFAIVTSRTGGSISAAGLYSAGPREGRDEVRATDMATGQTTDAVVDVVAGAVIRPAPGAITVPAGAFHRVRVLGGSGYYDLTTTSSLARYVNGSIEGRFAGRGRFDVTDRYTRQTTQIAFAVVAPLTFTATRSGDLTAIAVTLGPGDVDGDGFKDAIVGLAESDISGANAGAVFIYKGRRGGLDPVPARTLGGAGRNDGFGTAVATGDTDGDGLTDLIVGAPRADVGLVDNGAVYIYRGIAGGTFEAMASTVLAGRFASDAFGTSLATCDFNGDGRLDLAVGVQLGEDRDRRMISTDQGSVAIFLGHPDGYLDTPDVSVFGDVPQMDGSFAGVPAMRLGTSIAAGDVDGDDACDLIAASYLWRASGVNADGLVYVYKGIRATSTTTGGLETFPKRSLAATNLGDIASNLGRYVAAGDLDGDGRAEVAISQYLHETVAGRADNPGAVRVLRGGPLPARRITALAAAESADWTVEGTQAQDQIGWFPLIADADGMAPLDLIVGHFRDEAMGRPADAGAIAVYLGRNGMLPSTTPDRLVSGFAAEDRFGQAIASLGDLDGDRVPELFTLAGAADTYGRDYGVPYVVPSDPMALPIPVSLPGIASATQVGRGFDVAGDVDGDGYSDVIVGAALADLRTLGVNTGVAWLYRGSARGIQRGPALELNAFPGLSAADQFGFQVSRAGDFDGDGVDDFAVVARAEDRPNTFAAAQYVQTGMGCAGTRNDAGAVYVFRGRRGALPSTTPAFVWYGPLASQLLWSIAGGGDSNNDGFDDLIVGGPEWDRTGRNDTGGFAVLRGRPADPMGRITVICDADFTMLGLGAGDRMGASVAMIGDVDQDGCDDMAIGAPLEDLGAANQGTVRVLFGWGAMGCPAMPELATLVSGQANAQGGYAVGGGGDVDGDGIPDLAAGAVAFTVGRDATGAAWVIPGAYLAMLRRDVFLDDAPPTMTMPFTDAMRMDGLRADGVTAGERFGSAVALVPGFGGTAQAALLAGGPFGDYTGVALSGGARIFRYSTTNPRGLVSVPAASIAGESNRPGGRMGEWVAAGRAGPMGAAPLILVGGYESSGVGVDQGAVYVSQSP